jgi:hypothetical protein
VPKVLSWSGEAGNPVESEYILMQEATGNQFGEVWGNMKIDDKHKIVDGIVAIEKKLLSISFMRSVPPISVLMLAQLTENHRYGKLYFANDAFLGCEKAEIIGDVRPSLRNVVEDRFVIGPVVDPDFWHRQRASMRIDRGPCK